MKQPAGMAMHDSNLRLEKQFRKMARISDLSSNLLWEQVILDAQKHIIFPEMAYHHNTFIFAPTFTSISSNHENLPYSAPVEPIWRTTWRMAVLPSIKMLGFVPLSFR